ncbi:Mu transposase C-terminal domain-containing protein [Xanthomonas euvesicatoria]|uniref:Mu transposase C-terminal domain-containing protein n=1 Tax=Xanthomonas euvesicatoria TaxID=456327 RepID=UPI00240679AF|nr:Mu transposase C-terminal domain-containing protein [Xanthomonas euvesicatoria pv. allii]
MTANLLTPLTVGSTVRLDGAEYRLRHFVDLGTVLGEADDGRLVRLEVGRLLEEMRRGDDGADEPSVESSGFETLSEEAWAEAQRRAAVLAPLINMDRPSKTLVAEAGSHLGVDVVTVYRWLKRWRREGSISALAPQPSNGGRGKSRLRPEVEAVLAQSIQELFLTQQRLKPSRLMQDVRMRCRRMDLEPPNESTLRRRIASLAEKQVVEKRMGRKAAQDRFDARPGRFEGADWPNAVWQIDHTPMDVVIVDDVYRRHIGRPWLTLAIDVYSRCVAGFHLSLDKPSEVSVGMCLVHGVLNKEGWLAKMGIPSPWPIYGRPDTVHADNGKEFHGEMISRASAAYGFRLEWRMVATPHWGGHIERLIGTTNAEIQTIPGTTFANVAARGKYKPHEEAIMTFAECERYVAEYICGIYHQAVHSSLKRPPIKQFEAGVLGDGTTPARGLPAPIADPKRLRLDFMPVLKRTVQAYGLAIDGIRYYDPVLDPWVGRRDAKTKKPLSFLVRRDPRDISVVWFLDPDTDQYYAVPYRNLAWPHMTLWELREIRVQLKREGRAEVDEDLIFETYERLTKLKEDAQASTVKARMAMQKQRERGRRRSIEEAQSGAQVRKVLPSPAEEEWGDESGELSPYEIKLKR